MAAPAFAADPILIGVPTAQSGPVGVADQQDWLNGVTMAVEEINASGTRLIAKTGTRESIPPFFLEVMAESVFALAFVEVRLDPVILTAVSSRRAHAHITTLCSIRRGASSMWVRP